MGGAVAGATQEPFCTCTNSSGGAIAVAMGIEGCCGAYTGRPIN